MADLQYSMAIDDKISPTLKKVQTQVNGLNTNFIKLRETLLKISLGAIVKDTLDFARGIQQASNATGVAVDTVNNFANAVGQLGGSSQKAVGDVIDFVAGLKDAKDGSAGAQVQLAKVGVSLQDLASLSNEDIFKKTIDGLAKIEDAATRNALAVKLLGKNFKDIDVRQVASGMAAGGGGANVSALNAAAEAQKNLSKNLDNLRSALLNVMEPLNRIAATVNFTVVDFEKLIKIIAAAAGAYLILTRGLTGVTTGMNSVMNSLRKGGGVITWFTAQLTSIGNNFWLFFKNIERLIVNTGVAIGVFSKNAGTAAGVLGSLAAMAANVIRIFLKLGSIAGIIYTIAEALSFLEQKFIGTSYIDKFFNAIAVGLEMVTAEFGKWLNLPTDLIGRVLGIDKAMGLGDPLIALAKKAEEARKGLTSDAGAGRGGNADTLKQQLDYAEKLRAESQKVIDANRGQALEAKKIVEAYKLQNGELQTQMQFQNTLIGKDEDYMNRQTKMFEVQQNYVAQINQLRTKYIDMQSAAANGTDEEIAAFKAFASVYQGTIAKIAKEYENQNTAVTKLLNEEQVLKAAEQDRQNTITAITSQMERQATLGDQIRAAYDKLSDVNFEAAQMKRSPLEKQYAQIVEDARKAAREASLAFSAGFENMDLSASQAKELADGLEQIAQKYGKIAYAQKANLDTSRTWEQGWKEAFDSYIENASNAATQASDVFSSVTSNMNSAIDNFVDTGKLSFSGLARSIIADLAKIELKAAAAKIFSGGGGGFGGIFSGIASLFGFAEGGNPPINKPSIVGEKGPELFIPKTQGTIIPNGATPATGGNNTYITNNVTAMDAKSVAQLFAENRKTLFGTVEMARKEMSYAR